VLDGYAGTYDLSPGFVVNVTRDGSWLMTQVNEEDEKVGMLPESTTKFFFKNPDALVTFETDAQGRATGMVVHRGGVDQEMKRVK
jgi:hypothetical protein